jgi:thiol:disulfide interchange protein
VVSGPVSRIHGANMSVLTWLLGIVLLVQQPGGPAGLGGAPTIKLKALPAREAVAPGENVQVVLQLDIPKPWHMYHPIILDTGMATTFSFKAPPGVTVGEVRFPSPEYAELSGIRYLEFQGRVAALTTVKIDSAAKVGESVSIDIAVSGLACVEACVPVEAKETLKLSVKAGAAQQTNEDALKAAKAKLPPALADAPYLKGSTIEVSKGKVGINEPAELIATLKVEKGHHIQDRDPGVAGLVPTQIFIEAIDGIEIAAAEKQSWPEPKTREMAGVGRVREQAGDVKIRIPFKVTDAEIKLRSAALRALVYYQVCTDAGVCYPPAFSEAIVRFEIDPAIKGEKATGDATKGGLTAAPSGRESASRTYKTLPLPELLSVLLGAFLGGVILNVMPCVLPVLSIKILSFMQQAGEDRGRVFAMGLVYAGGILLCFAVLAVVMIGFGKAWGGFMQEPLYVAILAAIVFAFALSLLGVYEFRLPGAVESAAGSMTTREGYGGAFLNGLMAVALATPCVGPFLGSAVGTLVQLPPLVGGLGIMMVGVGLAFPYVLLTAFPQWLRFLPRPGKWMNTFKEVMGFVLLATVLWLLWVLQFQVASLISTLVVLLAVGVACWMLGRLTLSASAARTYGTYAAGLSIIACSWFGGQRLFGAIDAAPAGTQAASSDDHWRAWSPGLPEKLAAEGHTVYVDFTAKWCLTCQTNKQTVLKVDPVKSKLAELGVVMIEGDFTRKDALMQEELGKYDRAGVPLNIIFPAGKPEKAIVLPELLTSGIVLDALKQAGPSAAGASSVTMNTP